jgi:hypothetical protein
MDVLASVASALQTSSELFEVADNVTLAQLLGFQELRESKEKDDDLTWIFGPSVPAPPPSFIPGAVPFTLPAPPATPPPAPHCAREAPFPRVTHSRKRKHETPNSHVPRLQRCRSTFSYKFTNAEEEAFYRLYATECDRKSAKLNALVRACFAQFGQAWVTWDAIKDVAAAVGYSRSNNMFRTTWALTVSRYGRNSEGVQNNEVFGLNFPYWIADTSVPRKRGDKGNTLMRLAPEFFACVPPAQNQ